MQKGADGEFDETRNRNNKELLMKQKNMIKDHDNQLD